MSIYKKNSIDFIEWLGAMSTNKITNMAISRDIACNISQFIDCELPLGIFVIFGKSSSNYYDPNYDPYFYGDTPYYYICDYSLILYYLIIK